MEDIEGVVDLIVHVWLFVTARRQTSFQKMRKAATQEIWEIWYQSADNKTTLVALCHAGDNLMTILFPIKGLQSFHSTI